MGNHHTRFKGIGLALLMRPLIAAFALTFIMLSASAMSLTDFNAKPSHDRAVYVVDFVEKTTANLYRKNPQMAQQIRDWFSQPQEGKRYSEVWSACL